MINISNAGSEVKIKVSAANHWTYTFSWRADGGEDHAQFVAQSMRDNLTAHIRAAREESYNQGWKDAKKKARKETWFRGWWK